MKNLTIMGTAIVLGMTLARADLSEDVKASAKNLAEKANYAWTSKTAIEGAPFTPGPIIGKTDKEGFTMLSQETDGEKVEAILKENKGVIKTKEGWQTGDELPRPQPGEFNRAAMMGRMLLNVKNPVSQVENLVAKVKALRTAEGIISGDLTEEGTVELLNFGRRRPAGENGPPPPKNAKGSVKFWVKDGMLSKYELKLQATFTFGQDQQEREFGWTSTVDIKDIGAAKVEVPAEAKKKLAR